MHYEMIEIPVIDVCDMIRNSGIVEANLFPVLSPVNKLPHRETSPGVCVINPRTGEMVGRLDNGISAKGRVRAGEHISRENVSRDREGSDESRSNGNERNQKEGDFLFHA